MPTINQKRFFVSLSMERDPFSARDPFSILSAKLCFVWRVFIIHLVNFAKLRDVLIVAKLSVVVSTYKST